MTATHFTSLFSQEDLDKETADGYVTVQTHPSLPLFIYNYGKSVQYEGHWNAVTSTCRGLILDENGFIVARPFPKFKNYEEALADPDFHLPAGDPVVSEKMDGSLGIIYTYEGQTAVATRGSFTSDQAVWATAWLHENMPNFAQPAGTTTLVEIIYPDNRIVVDYKGVEELAFLGAIDNATGADILDQDVDWWIGPAANSFDWTLDEAIEAAKSSDFDSEEGVVLCWPQKDAPSIRLKVKNPRYVQLHRIVTGLSTRTVWESLRNGTFVDLLETAPDEFHTWIHQVQDDLQDQFDSIYNKALRDLMAARFDADALSEHHEAPGEEWVMNYTRRALAEQIVPNAKYPGLCFGLEDGKDISPAIWDMIKPERKLAMIVEDDG